MISSSQNTILGGDIINTFNGIEIRDSKYNTLRGIMLRSNTIGVRFVSSSILAKSSGNLIAECTFQNSLEIIHFGIGSFPNSIYHNNFINNSENVPVAGLYNEWDNGFEGNYWSTYNGTDLDNDGLGDSSYVIDVNNTDNYPLMGVFSSFNTSLGEPVEIISNSTIEDLEYFEFNSTIRMYVSNMTENQTSGFVRISIPHAMMTEPYNITIDGATPTYWNYTLYDNGTHRWIYFTYEHSTLEIIIIPEAPFILGLPLLLLATSLAALVYKKKSEV